MRIHFTTIIALIAIALLAVACVPEPPVGPGTGNPGGSTGGTETGLAGSGSDKMQTFDSKAELLAYLKKNQGGSSGSGGVFNRGMEVMAMDMAVSESAGMAVPMAAPSMVKSDGGGASDYSTTNIQVKGVDEADFIKNDGKYIYVLSGDLLVIADAFPAEDAEILSETHIKGNPQDIFINGERLVVFSTQNDERLVWPQYGVMPVPRYTPVTHAYVYDITDRDDPELVEDYSIAGRYFQSRMIGDHVYMVINDDAYYNNYFIDVPVVRESGATVVTPKIHYFDNPEDNYRFTTVASFDVNGDDINAESYLMGYANTLYVSQENIYIAYRKNFRYDYREAERDRFFDVVLPLLPKNVKSEIEAIDDGRESEAEKWDQISAVLEEMYNDLSETMRDNLVESIEEELEEYEAKRAAERSKSVIHKIGIDDGAIDYDGRGEVPGYLLNQWSLDEHRGNLRVATTVNTWTRSNRVMHNNVYVLDEGLDIIGEIEGIAPDERIYSTRFMGNRLYMVTFRQTDPFFVIDLSNPRDPEILGELKIPGWSSYLHPYDEDHIIGIGKETKENEWGGVTTLGVKIALFDVSDVKNPTQVDTVEIGTSGSDSDVLNDHKAFLFDKEKGLLVIPIREMKERSILDDYGWRQRVWQGAYVFDVDKNGFEKRGRISHYNGDESRYGYWGGPYNVRRSLYMDDVLYTISNAKIKMNNLDTLDDIEELELPYEFNERYPRPMPMVEVDMVR